MSYKQSNNPISRKTSPINKVNPYERGLGNTISEDKLDLTSGGTSVHKPSEHNPKLEGQPYPNPDFYERQSDMGVDFEADQPPYESDDYKPGMSRKSSSPLNKDDQWIQKATASIKERGTEGVCTGDKFGSASCPPGSKRYTLAKTFKKMAKNR